MKFYRLDNQEIGLAKFYCNKNDLTPDLHSFPAGTHIFAQHDAVEGDGTDQEEELLHSLVNQALLHAMLAHGRLEDAELLDDGGDGVGL